MISSMTGYGCAERTVEGVGYAVEIRGVNNRFLKVSIRLPEHLLFLESEIEKLLRDRLRRGSVTYSLRVKNSDDAVPALLDVALLQQYVNQLSKVQIDPGMKVTIDLSAAANLPGVCSPSEPDESVREKMTAVVRDLSEEALRAMAAMRKQEGQALARELGASCSAIRGHLRSVEQRAPNVVQEYHQRLRTRVELLLKEGGFELEQDGLMREVAIYAERCDITEELSRLASHLDQFEDLTRRPDQVGRTMDFLTQELLREANTIASKSNDAVIARDIVEVKGWIDRLREQVQNVE